MNYSPKNVVCMIVLSLIMLSFHTEDSYPDVYQCIAYMFLLLYNS